MLKKTLLKIIKDPLWVIGAFLKRIAPIITNDEIYIKLRYFFVMHKPLNAKHPKTFTEKLQWLKLYDIHEQYSHYVDKYEVKQIIESKIGKKYVIPTLGVWNNFDEIDFQTLPDKFILKCTHDSGSYVICKDKAVFDIKQARTIITKSLKKDFYKYDREYPYKNVPHRVIAETLLEDETGNDLKDYKFFCFNGRAIYCQVITDRTTEECIDFFDRNWIHQEFVGLQQPMQNSRHKIIKPDNYDEMCNIADKISKMVKAPFVRVDLYNVNKKIYFGEITFFPASGIGYFKPKQWNKKLGDLIQLPFEK